MLAFYLILFFSGTVLLLFVFQNLIHSSQSLCHRLSASLSVSLSLYLCISLSHTYLIPILSVCILQAITLLAQTKQQIRKPKIKLVGAFGSVRKFLGRNEFLNLKSETICLFERHLKWTLRVINFYIKHKHFLKPPIIPSNVFNPIEYFTKILLRKINGGA